MPYFRVSEATLEKAMNYVCHSIILVSAARFLSLIPCFPLQEHQDACLPYMKTFDVFVVVLTNRRSLLYAGAITTLHCLHCLSS